MEFPNPFFFIFATLSDHSDDQMIFQIWASSIPLWKKKATINKQLGVNPFFDWFWGTLHRSDDSEILSQSDIHFELNFNWLKKNYKKSQDLWSGYNFLRKQSASHLPVNFLHLHKFQLGTNSSENIPATEGFIISFLKRNSL